MEAIKALAKKLAEFVKRVALRKRECLSCMLLREVLQQYRDDNINLKNRLSNSEKERERINNQLLELLNPKYRPTELKPIPGTATWKSELKRRANRRKRTELNNEN